MGLVLVTSESCSVNSQLGGILTTEITLWQRYIILQFRSECDHFLFKCLVGRVVLVVDSLTLALLLCQGYLDLEFVYFALGDLCLHVGLVFSQLSLAEGIVCKQLFLKSCILHDVLAIVTVFGDLLLQTCNLLLLLLL